jgi:GBP family porin
VKRNLIAAIAGTMALAANAQSTVTITGYADGSVLAESGGAAGSVKKVSSGVSGPSRLIFRGSEDLGGGLSAFFHLEHGVTFDTGGSLQQNFWGRQSFLGISSTSVGTLRAGLVYTPLFTTMRDVADPFRNAFVAQAGNIMTSGVPAGPKSVAFPNPSAPTGTVASGGLSRANTLLYTTPNLSGFVGELAYSLGEQAGSESALRTIGGSAGYSQGPLNIRLAYEKTNNAAANDSARNTILGANYDFGMVKVYFGYGTNKGFGTIDNTDLVVGVNVPVGAGTIMASYVKKNDKSAANIDPYQIGLGYVYYLSKRTMLHASAAKIGNNAPNTSPAFYTVGSPGGPGSGDTAVAVGIGHFF